MCKKYTYFFVDPKHEDDEDNSDFEVRIRARSVKQAKKIAQVQFKGWEYRAVQRWSHCFECSNRNHGPIHTLFIYKEEEEIHGRCDMCGDTFGENKKKWKYAKHHPQEYNPLWFDPKKILA